MSKTLLLSVYLKSAITSCKVFVAKYLIQQYRQGIRTVLEHLDFIIKEFRKTNAAQLQKLPNQLEYIDSLTKNLGLHLIFGPGRTSDQYADFITNLKRLSVYLEKITKELRRVENIDDETVYFTKLYLTIGMLKAIDSMEKLAQEFRTSYLGLGASRSYGLMFNGAAGLGDSYLDYSHHYGHHARHLQQGYHRCFGLHRC